MCENKYNFCVSVDIPEEAKRKYAQALLEKHEGYLTSDELEQENHETVDDIFGITINKEDNEKRQRCVDFFGNAEDYYSYINKVEDEREYAKWSENFDPDEEFDADFRCREACRDRSNDPDYGIWDDSGICETMDEYLNRVCYNDSDYFYQDNNDAYENGEEYEMMMEEKFMREFKLNQDTSKMNNSEKREYKKLRQQKLDMFKHHMIRKLITEIYNDEFFTDLKEEWYDELVEKANKEAVNQAYLKGYADGHRDGFNDCLRGKEEDCYSNPDVTDSEYYTEEQKEKRRIKDFPWGDEIPF